MSGRFRKVNRIGRGTFGEAWLVTSVCSGRRYVMKEICVDEMTDDELEKAKIEATILARCKHLSIIRYKEYFMMDHPSTMCLVMEYADGGDLAGRVREAKSKKEMLSEDTVLHWFVQVIFAVQYLHTNNILHRDLKTQNIFLTRSNLVKVGDFGIARFLRDKQDLATTAVGTPYYLSPEICQRRPYNHKSDIWAVGCVLYELCALSHPFHANSFEDLIIKILRGNVRPLSTQFSKLVHDLTNVMLRTNPDRRPTADALLVVPGLKPYVQNYLLKHEELLVQRVPTTKHESMEKIVDSKRTAVKGISGDLGNIRSRRVCELDLRDPSQMRIQSELLETNNPRGRCASDSDLCMKKKPTPSSSLTPTNKCSTAPTDLNESQPFKRSLLPSPLPPSEREPSKERNLDTPRPVKVPCRQIRFADMSSSPPSGDANTSKQVNVATPMPGRKLSHPTPSSTPPTCISKPFRMKVPVSDPIPMASLTSASPRSTRTPPERNVLSCARSPLSPVNKDRRDSDHFAMKIVRRKEIPSDLNVTYVVDKHVSLKSSEDVIDV